MSDPILPMPDEEPIPDPWVPVEDLAGEDLPTPAEEGAEGPPDDPFAPVDDSQYQDIGLDAEHHESSGDPWADGPADEALAPTLVTPPPPLPRYRTAPVRLLDPPDAAQPPMPLPWRSAAEMRSPTAARLLCEANPRSPRTVLQVAAWEWLEDDDEHVRFRLADDGEDVIARVEEPGVAELPAAFRVAGQELLATVGLVVDRAGRGLVLGRDLLAGRFVVDPATDDWS